MLVPLPVIKAMQSYLILIDSRLLFNEICISFNTFCQLQFIAVRCFLICKLEYDNCTQLLLRIVYCSVDKLI